MLFRTIGFTGTRNGMTSEQRVVVEKILRRLKPEWVVHGDCIGADADFHDICIHLRPFFEDRFKIRVRPCDIESQRAFCAEFDEMCDVKQPLDRNRDIVDDALLLIGTPGTKQEELRSGTWATIRNTRKMGKLLIVIWPDGTVDWENFKNVRKAT